MNHRLPLLLSTLLALAACQQPGPAAPADTETRTGSNRRSLEQLAAPANGFAVAANLGPRYRVGDDIRFTVDSARAGWLWVVQVDADDAVTVLYPNRHRRDNAIRAGQPLRVPPAGAAWGLEAAEPLGPTLVAFIVTTGKDRLDRVLQTGAALPEGLRLRDDQPWGLAKQTITIEARQP